MHDAANFANARNSAPRTIMILFATVFMTKWMLIGHTPRPEGIPPTSSPSA
jgi:hypothetical protein